VPLFAAARTELVAQAAEQALLATEAGAERRRGRRRRGRLLLAALLAEIFDEPLPKTCPW
jgi:hypothetical protein